METRFKKPLSGIIPPLVTPLKNNETLDVESLERLIEHLIEGGVHGLFVLGTTGEEQSLSYDVRKQMIKESCRINRGRLPLLACITDTSIEESIRLARKAADYGADGVRVVRRYPWRGCRWGLQRQSRGRAVPSVRRHI